MATKYLRSAAAGAGTGADWANAYTTISNAFTGMSAGDTLYVSEDHSQSIATVNMTSPGTMDNPCFMICVDHTGSVPPVAADLRTTASITSTGGTGLNIGGSCYYYGVGFTCGQAGNSAFFSPTTGQHSWNKFENGSWTLGADGGGGFISMNALGAITILKNNPIHFTNSAHKVNMNAGEFTFEDTAPALTGTNPTNFITLNANVPSQIYLRNLDLDSLGSSSVVQALTGTERVPIEIVDCKINASTNLLSAQPPQHGGQELDAYRSGPSGNIYQTRIRRTGVLTQELTIIKTGGANDGTNGFAWKIVTYAESKWVRPFDCPDIEIWNETTGSAVTATVQGIWGGGAVPNDEDIWLEVEYLGSSGSPVGSRINDSKSSILAVTAGQDAGSGTWGGSTTKFKLNVTFTPQKKGLIFGRVKVAKASSTFYIDPKIILT